MLGFVSVVTPMGSSSNQPQEIEEGEAGFALLFPKIDGVKIHTFHFSKDVKNRVFDESKFAEAGMSFFSPLCGLLWDAALWGASGVLSRTSSFCTGSKSLCGAPAGDCISAPPSPWSSKEKLSRVSVSSSFSYILSGAVQREVWCNIWGETRMVGLQSSGFKNKGIGVGFCL